MSNRVDVAIAKVADRAAALSEAERADLDREMAVSFSEHFAYQQAQAQAHAAGRLSTAEAQVVYIALGEVGSAANGGWAAGTDLPTKVAVTLLMGELLAAGRRA